jgi:hypothetical protein
MLSKEYLVTGVFPKFRQSTRQLTVSKRLGIPTSISSTLLRRHHVMNKYITLRHGLKNPITFYAVTECDGNRLVSISDGAQTRYYWLASNRHTTYLTTGSCRDYEHAWQLLDQALKKDKRASAVQFAAALRPFFSSLPLMI